MKRISTFIPVVLLSLLLMFPASMAQAEYIVVDDHEQPPEFDIENYLFGHITNDYEFHITDVYSHKVTVPLPIIVRSEVGRGWFVFFSSKFHHKTQAYEGFSIAIEGEHKGLLVENLSDGSVIRPTFDLSITKNVFSILFVTVLLSVIFISIKRRYDRNPLKAPSGVQSLFEPLILFVKDDIAKPSIGEGYQKYMPFLLTIFFFVLTLNLAGLIPLFPFGANVSGNINFTACLAVCTFIVTMSSTTKHYWIDKLWTPSVPIWLKVPIPLMPLVEVVTIFTGPIALMVRLFANMLSGHMVVLVLIGLIFVFSSLGPIFDGGVSIVAILFSIFMLLLDVLVAFIQAYVFTLLSALYFGGARIGKEHN